MGLLIRGKFFPILTVAAVVAVSCSSPAATPMIESGGAARAEPRGTETSPAGMVACEAGLASLDLGTDADVLGSTPTDTRAFAEWGLTRDEEFGISAPRSDEVKLRAGPEPGWYCVAQTANPLPLPGPKEYRRSDEPTRLGFLVLETGETLLDTYGYESTISGSYGPPQP